MSNDKDPAGSNSLAGGEGSNQPKDTVTYETHRKLLDEKKRVQAEKEELANKLAAFEADKAKAQKEELERQGNYKKLLEQKEEENKKIKEEHDSLITTLQNAKKRQAVLRHIQGSVPADIVDKVLDTTGVSVDEAGEIDDATAKVVAQEFAQKYHYLIQNGKPNGGMPNGAPSPGGNKLSYSEWLKLPSKDMKKRMHEIDPSTMP